MGFELTVEFDTAMCDFPQALLGLNIQNAVFTSGLCRWLLRLVIGKRFPSEEEVAGRLLPRVPNITLMLTSICETKEA